MAGVAEGAATHTTGGRGAMRQKLIDLYRSRELLRQFVQKELKVRYKNSALGFLWSLVTPILMTVVFTVIFSTVIRIQVEDFAAFFLCGYLVWQFFQNTVSASMSSIVGNGPLVQKVYFPREILPLSIVLSQLVHFLLALLAVTPYLVWVRGWSLVTHLPSILLGIVVLTVFTAGLSMLLAGANVGMRDLQELMPTIFQVWFYATPIIYPFALIANTEGRIARVASVVLAVNPMTWFTRLFRESIYGEVIRNPACAPDPAPCEVPFLTVAQSWPSPQLALGTVGVALAVFGIGYALFNRFAVTFAKEV